MIIVPEFATFPEWGGYQCVTTPELVAEYVAYVIRDEHEKAFGDRWINDDGSNVCVLIKFFGHDKSTFECFGGPVTAPDAMKYFRPEDDIGYTGAGDAWRHPFLRNATTEGELRSWMVAFRDHLNLVRAGMTPPPTDDPNNYLFAFDTETTNNSGGVGFDVSMLQYLYDHPTIWNTWKVPGSDGWSPSSDHATNPTGKTLAQMYADMVAATAGTSSPWPAGFPTTLNQSQDIHFPVNRPYLVWYLTLCERAREGLMRASAYEVLNDPVMGWPGARCGNYNAAEYDGEDVDTTVFTTWFPDKSLWSSTLDPAVASSWSVPQHLTQEMPRKWFDLQPSPDLMDRVNVNDRMLTVQRRAYGSVDSPEMYSQSDLQWEGRPVHGHKGHWGLNPYVPAADQYPAITSFPVWGANLDWTPLKETKYQSRLRIERHMVEGIIDSGSGGHEDRLCPWVNQFILVGATHLARTQLWFAVCGRRGFET